MRNRAFASNRNLLALLLQVDASIPINRGKRLPGYFDWHFAFVIATQIVTYAHEIWVFTSAMILSAVLHLGAAQSSLAAGFIRHHSPPFVPNNSEYRTF